VCSYHNKDIIVEKYAITISKIQQNMASKIQENYSQYNIKRVLIAKSLSIKANHTDTKSRRSHHKIKNTL
jgi:hypothetical protein